LGDLNIVEETKTVDKQLKTKGQDIKNMSSQDWQSKMSTTRETDKVIDKISIIKNVEQDFDVPIKNKVTKRMRKAVGIYQTKDEIIRLKTWGELEPLTHEVAHHIDKKFKPYKNMPTNIKSELKKLDYDNSKNRISEGFSEFMRHYLTDTGALKTKAPLSLEYFEKNLFKNHKLSDKLSNLKNQLQVWKKQGAINRINSQIDYKGELLKKPLKEKIKDAYTVVQKEIYDEFYSVEKIVEEIQNKIGKKLKPSENPYELLTMAKSKSTAIARTMVMKKSVNLKGEIKGKGLVEILTPIENINEFIAYGVAKNAKKIESKGKESGFDINDIDYVIKTYQNETYDKAVQELKEYSDNLLDILEESGALSKESVNLIKKTNPVYLPFKRVFLDDIQSYAKGSKQGVYRLKGSGRPIYNPLEVLIAQTASIINKAQKASIAKSFSNLTKYEGIGKFITKVPGQLKVNKIKTQDIASKLKSEYGELIDIEALEESEINDILTFFTSENKYTGKDNVISIFKEGKPELYEVHPELYEVLESIAPIKRNFITEILSPFARMLRLGATGLKASFSIRNPFKDALTYTVFSEKKTANPLDLFTGLFKQLTIKEGSGKWKFQNLGGALSGMFGYDRASTMKVYDEIINDKYGKTVKTIKHPIQFIQDLFSITEQTLRLEEFDYVYKKSIKENPEWTEWDAFIRAFNSAQDVTINFTRSGKTTKKINEISAFFNSAVQGPNKLYRTLKARPVQTIVKGLSLLTPIALINWFKNKDEEWYKNLPYVYKYSNVFKKVGDEIIRLPIPYDVGTIFMAMPVFILDQMNKYDKEKNKALLELFEKSLPMLSISAVQPLVDVFWKNKNYLGQPIETESERRKWYSERSRNYTSKYADILSKGFGKLGFKISPIQFDYLISQYSGGFFNQFNVGKTGRAYDIPVISDFLIRSPNKPKRQLNEFFDRFEKLQQKNNSGILTRDDLIEYNSHKKTYKNVILKNFKLIKRYQKENDRERFYENISNGLKKIGYE